MSYYYFWFIIFSIFAYLIITDNSIAYSFFLISKIVKFKYEKIKWWIFNSPDNFIVRWSIHRRSMRIAKELQKELAKDIKK